MTIPILHCREQDMENYENKKTRSGDQDTEFQGVKEGGYPTCIENER